MEPSALTKAGSKQEEGFGVQSRRVADLGLVPNLRRSNSSLCRSRRSQYLFNSCEKVGFLRGSARGRGDVLRGRDSCSGLALGAAAQKDLEERGLERTGVAMSVSPSPSLGGCAG